MAEFQQSPKAARTLAEDDPSHGVNTVSPLMNGIAFLVFSISWVVFFNLQITSTKEAVLSMLMGGIQITSPAITAEHLLQFTQGTLDRNQTIANSIAWGFQLFMLLLAFPSDRAFVFVHRKYNMERGRTTPRGLAKKTQVMAKMKTYTLIVLMAADVAADFFYASTGHAVISGFNFLIIPNISSPGGFLVSALYTLVINAVNIYIGTEALHRMEDCIDSWSSRKDG
jgi:hypothetical protein